jgi:hypothetical protein
VRPVVIRHRSVVFPHRQSELDQGVHVKPVDKVSVKNDGFIRISDAYEIVFNSHSRIAVLKSCSSRLRVNIIIIKKRKHIKSKARDPFYRKIGSVSSVTAAERLFADHQGRMGTLVSCPTMAQRTVSII